jgi:chromosome segregation ATPase
VEISKMDQLEDRIRKAASLLQTLKQEKERAEGNLQEREQEIVELQARLAEAPDEDLSTEVETLRTERNEILTRVNKMLALLDVEDSSPAQKSLLAAVDGTE